MADVIAVIRDIAIIIVALLDIVILGTIAVLAIIGFRFFLKLKAATPDLIQTSKSTLKSWRLCSSGPRRCARPAAAMRNSV